MSSKDLSIIVFTVLQAKKQCYACAKENEKAEDASTDAKGGKTKDMTKVGLLKTLIILNINSFCLA